MLAAVDSKRLLKTDYLRIWAYLGDGLSLVIFIEYMIFVIDCSNFQSFVIF